MKNNMDAKELRIGNYVKALRKGFTHGETDIIQIESIIYEGVNRWKDMGASDVLGFDEIKPIPLTVEWLLKFGFKYEKPFYRKIDFGIRKYKNHYGFFFLLDHAYVDSIILSDIKYVHQLQNLYFCLTGKELEI